jgi:hypothetical protein
MGAFRRVVNNDGVAAPDREHAAAPCRCERLVFSTRLFHEDDLPQDLKPSLALLGRVCGSCGSDGRPAGFVDIDLGDDSHWPHFIPVCSRCADALGDAEIQEQVFKRFFDCVEFLGGAGTA